jgi:hypothetical protein
LQKTDASEYLLNLLCFQRHTLVVEGYLLDVLNLLLNCVLLGLHNLCLQLLAPTKCLSALLDVSLLLILGKHTVDVKRTKAGQCVYLRYLLLVNHSLNRIFIGLNFLVNDPALYQAVKRILKLFLLQKMCCRYLCHISLNLYLRVLIQPSFTDLEQLLCLKVGQSQPLCGVELEPAVLGVLIFRS